MPATGFDENNVLVGNDNDQAFGSNARAWAVPPWLSGIMRKLLMAVPLPWGTVLSPEGIGA